jgi:calcineurin-like phosphoesterase family protein
MKNKDVTEVFEMFEITKFKQLQNLIEQLGSIAADEDTYSTKAYTRSTGSYKRVKWKYNNLIFSIEYPNSHKDKRGLHHAYVTTRKSLNLIGLSVADMSSLSKDYIGKNVDISEKLYDVWEVLKKERIGIFSWFN